MPVFNQHPGGAGLLIPHPYIYIPRFPRVVAPAGDWWLAGGIDPSNCTGAYQAKGAASLASSYVNLNNPGVKDLTLGVAPTWSAGVGWTFNGTTQHLNTGLIPTINSNNSLIVAVTNAGSGIPTGWIHSGARRYYVYPVIGTNQRHAGIGGTSLSYGAFSVVNGSMGIAGLEAFTNGIDDAQSFGAWSGSAGTQGITIGCRRNNLSSINDGYFPGDILACAYYNVIITNAQMLAVHDAIAAL